MSDKQVKYMIGLAIILALGSFYISSVADKKADNRFKSYDMEFLLEHGNICLDANQTQVKEYYMKFNAKTTPLGKRWIQGDFLCHH